MSSEPQDFSMTKSKVLPFDIDAESLKNCTLKKMSNEHNELILKDYCKSDRSSNTDMETTVMR